MIQWKIIPGSKNPIVFWWNREVWRDILEMALRHPNDHGWDFFWFQCNILFERSVFYLLSGRWICKCFCLPLWQCVHTLNAHPFSRSNQTSQKCRPTLRENTANLQGKANGRHILTTRNMPSFTIIYPPLMLINKVRIWTWISKSIFSYVSSLHNLCRGGGTNMAFFQIQWPNFFYIILGRWVRKS